MIAAWDVPLITGQARAEETLVSAGLAGAIAVICAQENDLSALETALLVRRLRAEVRVIAQLANPAVGRAVREAGVAVLDVAGLSAPSVVEVCLGEGVQELSLSGMRFLAARTTAPHAATLRELYGALAPVAVVPPTGDVLVCPGRDTPVRRGRRGDADRHPGRAGGRVRHRSPGTDPPARRHRQPRRQRGGRHRRTARDPRGARRRGSRRPPGQAESGRARRSGGSATWPSRSRGRPTGGWRSRSAPCSRCWSRPRWCCTSPTGCAGPGHRISLLESVYFTIETVTTVGYGDYTFRGEPAWLIIFAVGLMITGALFVAVFFALLTNMLVSRRIEESLGLQRIVALRGHILVIGLGTIGLRVVRKLHDLGREVAVIEKDEHNRHLGQVRALRVPVMIADATLPEVLASARLAAASAVAVLTSDDLANLETGLAVRDQLGARWREVPVVLRIFDPQLAHSVKETFGFRNVRSTAALAAPWFVGAALGLDVLSTFYAGDEPLLVARLTVTPGGGLHGLQMHELAARTRVLALRRAADRAVLEHPPRRATRFEPADEAYLIGPYDELLTVLRRDRPSPGQPPDEVTPQASGPSDQAPNSADHAVTPPGHMPDRPDQAARTPGQASGPSGPGELTRPDHG